MQDQVGCLPRTAKGRISPFGGCDHCGGFLWLDRGDIERRCINCGRPEYPVVVPDFIANDMKRRGRNQARRYSPRGR